MAPPTPLLAPLLAFMLAPIFAVASSSKVAAAEVTHALVPGWYRVEVISKDPKSGDQHTTRITDRCLDAAAIDEHRIFGVLGQSPVAGCPNYEVCAGATRTGFIAQCVHSSAIGMFALEGNTFRGRIEVKDDLGTLNYIELQYATRLGDCSAVPSGKP